MLINMLDFYMVRCAGMIKEESSRSQSDVLSFLFKFKRIIMKCAGRCLIANLNFCSRHLRRCGTTYPAGSLRYWCQAGWPEP